MKPCLGKSTAVSGRGMCIDVSKADISGSNCFITAELGGGAIYTSYKGNVVDACVCGQKNYLYMYSLTGMTGMQYQIHGSRTCIVLS